MGDNSLAEIIRNNAMAATLNFLEQQIMAIDVYLQMEVKEN